MDYYNNLNKLKEVYNDNNIINYNQNEINKIVYKYYKQPIKDIKNITSGYTADIKQIITLDNNNSFFLKLSTNKNTVNNFINEYNFYNNYQKNYMPKFYHFDKEFNALFIEDLSFNDFNKNINSKQIDKLFELLDNIHNLDIKQFSLSNKRNNLINGWNLLEPNINELYNLKLIDNNFIKNHLNKFIELSNNINNLNNNYNVSHMDFNLDNLCFKNNNPVLFDYSDISLSNKEFDYTTLLISLIENTNYNLKDLINKYQLDNILVYAIAHAGYKASRIIIKPNSPRLENLRNARIRHINILLDIIKELL